MQAIYQVLGVLAATLNIYLIILFVRILLSWFPNVDQSNPMISWIPQITDPYLNVFRGIIPPIGGFDLSALLAILALQFSLPLISGAQQTLAGSFY